MHLCSPLPPLKPPVSAVPKPQLHRAATPEKKKIEQQAGMEEIAMNKWILPSAAGSHKPAKAVPCLRQCGSPSFTIFVPSPVHQESK